MATRETEAMEKMLVLLEKKGEGRPLPPEDYDFMAAFVDRVEKRVEKKRREEDIEEKRRYEEALATVPELTFEIDILDVDLKEHVLYILQEAGIETLGQLVLQMRLDPDKVLGLNGIGPKIYDEIVALTDALRVTPEEAAAKAAETAVIEDEVEAEVEVEAEAEPAEAVEEPVETEAQALVEEMQAEAEPEVESPAQVEEKPVAAEKKPTEATEEKKEEDEFDKLFSYDARKYGYYKAEPAKIEEDDEEDKPKAGKKKKKSKKRRQNFDESDEWEQW
jgi:N utilization substance protein A